MTFGEVSRAVDSFMRTHKLKQKEKAINSYILANMIGVSVGMRLGGKGQFPKIEKFYPNLFEEEEQKQIELDAKTKLSVARFRSFAIQYNKRYQEASNKE